MRLAVLGLVLLVSACSGPDPYAEFRERVEAGGTCPDLLAFRNGLDANSSALTAINSDLREIGCYSATSVRQEPLVEGERQPAAAEPARPTFTVQEYRVYRAIIDTPMSVSEEESVARAAKQFGISEGDVNETVDKVQRVLAGNNWYGSADAEIRSASDWRE